MANDSPRTGNTVSNNVNFNSIFQVENEQMSRAAHIREFISIISEDYSTLQLSQVRHSGSSAAPKSASVELEI